MAQSDFPRSLFSDWKHLVTWVGGWVSTVGRELADRLGAHLFPRKGKLYFGAPTPTSPKVVCSVPLYKRQRRWQRRQRQTVTTDFSLVARAGCLCSVHKNGMGLNFTTGMDRLFRCPSLSGVGSFRSAYTVWRVPSLSHSFSCSTNFLSSRNVLRSSSFITECLPFSLSRGFFCISWLPFQWGLGREGMQTYTFSTSS